MSIAFVTGLTGCIGSSTTAYLLDHGIDQVVGPGYPGARRDVEDCARRGHSVHLPGQVAPQHPVGVRPAAGLGVGQGLDPALLGLFEPVLHRHRVLDFVSRPVERLLNVVEGLRTHDDDREGQNQGTTDQELLHGVSNLRYPSRQGRTCAVSGSFLLLLG